MAGYERNTANQKLVIFLFDTTTGAAKTGDAANITVYYKELGGSVTALDDGAAGEATELSATNAPGYYEVDLLNTELDTAYTYFFPKSSTANVGAVVAMPAFTVPAGFSAGTGQVAIADNGITAAKLATDAIDEIVDAVWDENIDSAHQTANTAGKRLDDASTNLDATVSSRSTFDHTTNQVLLTTATQDQINAIEASFSGLGITFVTTGTPTTTSVPISGTNLGDTTGDHNRQLCVFTSGGDGVIGVARWITTFTATGEGAGTLAFSGSANTPDAELPVAPAAGVSGIILGRR